VESYSLLSARKGSIDMAVPLFGVRSMQVRWLQQLLGCPGRQQGKLPRRCLRALSLTGRRSPWGRGGV
jgi:hypothetical protein